MDGQPAPGMNCPMCHTGLTMSERQGIEIDYCPRCRGVWLDRGELDKIIERAAPPASSRPEPRTNVDPRMDSGHYHEGQDQYRSRKRKKSFFEELFD